MTTATILAVDQIGKRFESIRAVDGVSFSVDRGEILGFLGPNGAGKTTTLRMILGILQPDEGDVRFTIDDRAGNSSRSASSAPKERTGYLPEERGLYGDAHVLDLLVYFGELKGLDRREARRRAQDWLGRFDLRDWEDKKIEKLSKGMQQKVQFIAAVLHRPDFVVLDEPFSGLDPVNQDLLKEIIHAVRDEGTAVLLSSHQMNRVEELCDRIFLIHQGRRVLYGGLDEIKEGHGEFAVQIRFSGEANALRELPGVLGMEERDGRATFTLSGGVTPNTLIRSIPENIEILSLSVDRPPLHDIFVRTIEGGAS